MVAPVAASISHSCSSTQRSALPYVSRIQLKAPSEARYRRPCFTSRSCFSMREAIIGVTVSDTTAEMAMAIESVTANSRKSRPTSPPIRRIGMKTASSDAVIDTMVKPICLAPLNAACIGESPASMNRETFSVTTMASSTTKPVEMVSAISDRLSRL